jgi:hypothetical protein
MFFLLIPSNQFHTGCFYIYRIHYK